MIRVCYRQNFAPTAWSHYTRLVNEEKVLMNRRKPEISVATLGKWQPLHTLAASGEFYLVDTLTRYNVDINVPHQQFIKQYLAKSMPSVTIY
uniref:Ankyrin repeat domain-containing protein, chloroplastic n=1 Tax=Tanacetum cinerariifolium TaxID=118510 RepID=A0A6L2KL12_TANCI|nr:ankyrin repeat domain-containing protein, chloroplastic [Tanacetum cinerariifolium]